VKQARTHINLQSQVIKASDKTPQYSYSSLKQKNKKDKIFSIIQQNKWTRFFIVWPLVFEFCDSALIIVFFLLFISKLPIMLHKGVELSCMVEIICLDVL